jgi:hypothetical protein
MLSAGQAPPIPPTVSRQRPPGATTTAQPRQATPSAIARIKYLSASNIVVLGPATGRKYAFSAGSPIQSVDARDAAALLRTRQFASV